MDLYAYANIQNVEAIAEANGIKVPRLRGYRLMKDEVAISKERMEEMLKNAEADVFHDAVTSIPRFRPESSTSEFSLTTDRLKKKYLIFKKEKREDCEGNPLYYDKIIGFRWNLIHGKNRKAIKLALKHKRKAVKSQYETFSKYAGREDVLMIHARIGGGNWSYYGGEQLKQQPWFLEKVDDSFDPSYCDIYAKIKV